MKPEPDTSKARELVLAGADLAGGAVSGAIGFFAAGPGGAAALGAAGVAVTRSLTYAADKFMTQRERARVGSVAAIAVSQIKEKSARGELPRQDFFPLKGEQQSTGEQLLEGVLLKARDEYEQRKLPYIAHFYANLVFAPAIAPPVAFMLLKTLEKLTYRQLTLLAVIHRSGILDVSFLRSQEHQDPQIESLKREEMDLHGSDLGSLGLVAGVGAYDDHLSKLGLLLTKLAELDGIPEPDQEALLHLMNPP